MALVTISLYNLPQPEGLICHIVCHGVREGRYGDMWEIRKRLTPDGPDALSALQALVGLIESLQRRSDADGLPG